MTVDIIAVIEGLTSVSNGSKVFLNIEDGKIYSDNSYVPDDCKPDIEKCLALPDKFDIGDWDIMKEFAESQEDEKIQRELLNAINGPGAFRYFNDKLSEFDLYGDFVEFQDEAYLKIAQEWCIEHGLKY